MSKGMPATRVVRPPEPRTGMAATFDASFLDEWLTAKCYLERSVAVREGANSEDGRNAGIGAPVVEVR